MPHQEFFVSDLKGTPLDSILKPQLGSPSLMIDPEQASYLKQNLRPLINQFLSYEWDIINKLPNESARCRPCVPDLRHICDVCSTSILNLHFACTICGVDVCIECMRRIPDGGDTSELSAAYGQWLALPEPVAGHPTPTELVSACMVSPRHTKSCFIPVTKYATDLISKWVKELDLASELSKPTASSMGVVQQDMDIPPTLLMKRHADDVDLLDFQREWCKGKPVVITNAIDRATTDWSPEAFRLMHGAGKIEVIDCYSMASHNLQVHQFFSAYDGDRAAMVINSEEADTKPHPATVANVVLSTSAAPGQHITDIIRKRKPYQRPAKEQGDVSSAGSTDSEGSMQTFTSEEGQDDDDWSAGSASESKSSDVSQPTLIRRSKRNVKSKEPLGRYHPIVAELGKGKETEVETTADHTPPVPTQNASRPVTSSAAPSSIVDKATPPFTSIRAASSSPSVRTIDRKYTVHSVFKIKDWPPNNAFVDVAPAWYNDYMDNILPIPEYCSADGMFNLSNRLPPSFVKPDLGPKMFIAFGLPPPSVEDLVGTTNIHCDMTDAVNVICHARPNDLYNNGKDLGIPDVDSTETTSDGVVAIWHIFRYEDLQALRTFLTRLDEEYTSLPIPFGTRQRRLGEKCYDPLHSQWIYLTGPLLNRLQQDYGVTPWTVYQKTGDAVYVPAGCAHQVRNLQHAIKCAFDFVSPENICRSADITQQFSNYGQEDVLQLKSTLLSAWAQLSTSSSPSKPSTSRSRPQRATRSSAKRHLVSTSSDVSSHPLPAADLPTLCTSQKRQDQSSSRPPAKVVSPLPEIPPPSADPSPKPSPHLTPLSPIGLPPSPLDQSLSPVSVLSSPSPWTDQLPLMDANKPVCKVPLAHPSPVTQAATLDHPSKRRKAD
ncbi:hypothetical protein DM01DRAFT_1338936 [Hesseltinella vesiculosa]|uniref:JmjC domain-containing protein n=1 Tax=Hesseltinella vesiculosa TaxID=101127 RepID=A0A1X2G8E1_9FUNG|nr:hypothetical protein DM01DRAFT_1338936 [Hesseltinella vesiculosa]